MGHADTGSAITRGQIRAWSAADLTDNQVDRIVDAIPHSSIPDAVADIAFAVLNATDGNR